MAVLKVVLSLQMSIYTELEHPSILVKVVPAAAQVDPERQLLLDATSTAIAEEQVDVVDNTAVETPSHPLAFQPLPLLRLAYLCILFSMDSFASSLIPTSFVAYYFQLRFNASVAIITRTFGAAAIIGGLSQLLAGSIARRAGIIMTMVGTHSAFAFFLSRYLQLICRRSAGANPHGGACDRTHLVRWTRYLPRQIDYRLNGRFGQRCAQLSSPYSVDSRPY